MPIKPIVLQRRHAELGRIRLGQKVPTANGKSRPAKLEEFRFTSPNERHIRDLAALYGGEVRAWDNAGKAEWEVFTNARTIPVRVVKGGLSQWMEHWSAGGCARRCDGERETLTDSPCICEAENRPERLCKPTTRLSVMLRDLDAIGVWRLETHGWNAAAELPGVAELAQHVGDLVPANLTLHERTSIRDGKTSRFVVPGLDLEISASRLFALVSGQTAAPTHAVEGAAVVPAAIAATTEPAVEDVPDYENQLRWTTSIEQCQTIWHEAGRSGHLTDELKAAVKARASEIDAEAKRSPDVEAEATSEPAGYDPDLDVDEVWTQVVAEAGRKGLDDAALRARLVDVTGARAEDATAGQLASFLTVLKTGEAVPA